MIAKRKPKTLRKSAEAFTDLTGELLIALAVNHDFVELVVDELCEDGTAILANFSEMGMFVHKCVHDPDRDHESASRLRESLEPFIDGQDPATVAVALYPIIEKIVAQLADEAEAPEMKGQVN